MRSARAFGPVKGLKPGFKEYEIGAEGSGNKLDRRIAPRTSFQSFTLRRREEQNG